MEPNTLRRLADALNDEIIDPDAKTPDHLDDVSTFNDLELLIVQALLDAADEIEAKRAIVARALHELQGGR